MSNLHQYVSFELQKLPVSEHNRYCICIVSILVGNGYYQLVAVHAAALSCAKVTAIAVTPRPTTIEHAQICAMPRSCNSARGQRSRVR